MNQTQSFNMRRNGGAYKTSKSQGQLGKNGEILGQRETKPEYIRKGLRLRVRPLQLQISLSSGLSFSTHGLRSFSRVSSLNYQNVFLVYYHTICLSKCISCLLSYYLFSAVFNLGLILPLIVQFPCFFLYFQFIFCLVGVKP